MNAAIVSLVMVCGLAIATTGLLKDNGNRKSRYQALCQTAKSNIRSGIKEMAGVYVERTAIKVDLLTGNSFEIGPDFSLDCHVRTGVISYLVVPATAHELQEDSRPYRKITYDPIAPRGRCAEKQEQLVVPVSRHEARYSIVVKPSAALLRGDIELGIRGAEVKVTDDEKGEPIAEFSYFFIKDSPSACGMADASKWGGSPVKTAFELLR